LDHHGVTILNVPQHYRALLYLAEHFDAGVVAEVVSFYALNKLVPHSRCIGVWTKIELLPETFGRLNPTLQQMLRLGGSSSGALMQITTQPS
jgi:hypothetical protein